MKIYSHEILNSARKLWARNSREKFPYSPNQLWVKYINQYKKVLDLFQPGNYYCMLFDLVIGDVVAITDDVQEVLGNAAKEITLEHLLINLHEEDKKYFIRFEDLITQFLHSIPSEEYPYYKIQYDLRLKTNKGCYKRILLQIFIVNYDEDNIFHSFHIHTDISHIKVTGHPTCSIIGIEGRPSYLNIGDNGISQVNGIFTKREIEILNAIVNGKTSKQIADEFFISYYTVNSHRRNILEKANVKTPLELIQKAISNGWV